ncbi:MAG TPA: chemotaxis protein CheW [Methylomirabilota bacterium]|nr:chemotaxis protein CheW [Methylomirabilota bacterium]
MAEEAEPFVLFDVAGTTYATPSASVRHIEMLEHITIVPNAHPAIEGVVFSRGQVIPALNLRARFGFAKAPHDIRTRIVFVQVHERVVGLIVDSAREFLSVPASAIRPIEEALAGVAGNYLKGLTTIRDRLVLILNIEAVLNLELDPALAESLQQAAKLGAAQAATTSAQS